MASAACLAKYSVENGVRIPTDLMIAPELEVPGLLATGYVRAQCPKDLSAYKAYVERVCKETDTPQKLSASFGALLGGNRFRTCIIGRAGLAEAAK